MKPKKKISLARDIFERKEREERQREQRNAVGFVANLKIPPEAVEKIKKLFEEEAKRSKRDNGMERIKKFIGSMFFLLALFTATLGSIWLIKIFWRGIFG